jgi:general secretion pathway protein H
MGIPGAAPATMIRPPRIARGFTLIELIVVILLVGLVVSFAVLSVGGPSPRQTQHEEARRLLARMDLAREEAVMQARSLGVRFERDGYLFYGMRDGQWRMLEQGGLIDPHELPEAIFIDVEIEGLDVELFGADDTAEDGDGGDEGDEEAVGPQLFFLAGGEIVPDFSIRILSADTDTEYRIHPGDEQWLTLSEEPF